MFLQSFSSYELNLLRTISVGVSMIACSLTLSGCNFNNYALGAVERQGNTIIVRRGGDFQAALEKAHPGDVITLEAGATFKGAFKLPTKPGDEFITIRTSAPDSQLPPSGTRIDPAKYGSLLPKIESDLKGEPAIAAATGAHHYRFIGVEFGPTIEGHYDIIQIGRGDERKIEDLPHHIEFDRVYIHGSPTHGQRRGIAANGKFISIKNSYISEIKRKGDESQAIAAWATDGPIEIENNYLEAAGINVLFGGAGSYLKLVPSDGTVRNNHLNKPVAWREENWVVKNLFEIKNGRRIKVENNLMTNNWGMAQDGFAILVTTRDEGNGDKTAIEDIEISNNVIDGSAGGVNIWGGEGAGGRDLVIRNNLFKDIDGKKWSGAAHFMKLSGWEKLDIEANTIIQTGSIAVAYGKPISGFTFRNNIVFHNEYGIFGDSVGSGPKALNTYFPGGLVANNVIIGGDPALYKEPNFYPRSADLVGFIDLRSGDFRLGRTSPFQGKRIGADIDLNKVGGVNAR